MLCCAVLEYYSRHNETDRSASAGRVAKKGGGAGGKRMLARPPPLTSSQRASPDLPIDPPARTQIGALIYAEGKQSAPLQSHGGADLCTSVRSRDHHAGKQKSAINTWRRTTKDDAFKNGTSLLSKRSVKCALAQTGEERSACVWRREFSILEVRLADGHSLTNPTYSRPCF